MNQLRQRAPRYENRRLTSLAQHVPCMFVFPHQCSGLTMACHSNWQQWGKGVGVKVGDWAWASGCMAAHREIDGKINPTMTKEERQNHWVNAFIATQDYLWLNKLVKVA